MSGSITSNFDPTIPLRVGQGVAQQNPLAQVGQFAQTLNAINQTKLFPGQLAQQQAQTTGMQRSTAYGFLAPLLAVPPSQWTHQAVTDMLGRAEAAGAVTQPLLADLASAPGGDGQALHDYLAPFIASQMQTGAAERLQAVTPRTMLQDTGMSVVPLNIAAPGAPVPGALTQPGGSVRKTLTPGEAAQPVAGPVGPLGQTTTVPLGVRTPSDISGLPMGPGYYRSQVPAALQNPNAPPMPQSAMPGQVTTSLGPGQTAAMTAAGPANVSQAMALQSAASSVPAQKALLGNLEANLNQFTSGPGADWKNFAKSFVNANNPFPINVFDPKTIASQEEFSKQAFQLAQQQFQALGGTGTDSKLDSTMHTSPSVFLSNFGNKGIIQLLKGNADATQAMNNEWQTRWLPSHGYDPSTYGQFVNQWNQVFDPRVFQSVYMDNQDRQKMLQGMTAGERDAFRLKYNAAVNAGLIPNPAAANAGQ